MGHKRNKAQKRTLFKEKFEQKRKDFKEHSKEKRARMVVKNLPFKTTEAGLKEHFEKYGAVKEVTLLKRPDGKLVGCGFVQFVAVQDAAKAKFHIDGKPFMGRDISCDFAISKDRYLKKIKEEKVDEVTIKEESIDLDESVVKLEDGIEMKQECDDNKEETKSQVDHSKNEEEVESEDDENESDSGESEDEEEEQESSDEDDKKDVEVIQTEDGVRKPHVISNDVTEGKTVFIKNIPFDATKEDLRECMLQFGPVFYALICMDRMTEHSKGTGFVKFRNKEDADKCLQAGTELQLLDNILDCHPALNKNDIQKKSQEKDSKKVSDTRNLYLVKEGVVLASSKSAEGVSASDMAKRLQLEQHKTQILRNLNMFISRNRLIVHNLPPNWEDSKLRALLMKHAGSKAVIREAKIMRDMKNVDSKGMGSSKEFGFVTFTTHEHALNALRSLNNNPNIFTMAKRPIVAFSIENRVMVKTKEKRLEHSRQRNPLSKQFDPTAKYEPKKGPQVLESKEYSGVAATPGIKKMRSRYNLKTQAQMHHENLRMEKRKKKLAKKPLKVRQEDFTKQPRQKINKKHESDQFSKMVNDYKRKLSSAISNKDVKRSKWYE